jgi:hypothetical protein
MDDPVGVFKRLEEISRVTQISDPTGTQLLSRWNSIKAESFVTVRQQLPNDELS